MHTFKLAAAMLAFCAPIAAQTAAQIDAIDVNTPLAPSALRIDPVARARALQALPSTGLLLVTDSTNKRVMALSPVTGALITDNFIVDTVNLTTPLNAILSSDGTQILVSDQVKDTVNAYNVDTGAFVGIFAPQGGVNNALIDNNRGIELAPNGDLLVTVAAGGNIDAIARFSAANGAPLAPLVPSASVLAIRSPYDVFRIPRTTGALSAGQYLVSSADAGKITRFDAAGALIGEFATAGTFAQQIAQASNGNILVGGFGVNADGVFEFTPAGVQVARLDDPNIGGYRGVYELPNGNVLTTTGSGVFELNRSTGVVQNNQVSGVQARYIEFVQGAGADVAISKSTSASQVSGGATVQFLLTARNLSPALDASNVIVTDTLPAGLSYVSNSCSANVLANTLTWTLPSLARASSQSCTLTTQVTGSGTLSNRASISANGLDPVPGNNSSEASVVVQIQSVPATQRLALSILAGLITLIAALWVGARRD
jgi:uncharacterized repeat protein (TIGR01451 family)